MTARGQQIRGWVVRSKRILLADIAVLLSIPLIIRAIEAESVLGRNLSLALCAGMVVLLLSDSVRRLLLWRPIDGLTSGLAVAFRPPATHRAAGMPASIGRLSAALTALGVAAVSFLLLQGHPLLVLAPWFVREGRPAAMLQVLSVVEVGALLILVPRLPLGSHQVWLLTIWLAGTDLVLRIGALIAPGFRAAQESWPNELSHALPLAKAAVIPLLAAAATLLLWRTRACFAVKCSCWARRESALPGLAWPRRGLFFAWTAAIALASALGHRSARRMDLARALEGRDWLRTRYVIHWQPSEIYLSGFCLHGWLGCTHYLADAAAAGDLEQVRALLPAYLQVHRWADLRGSVLGEVLSEAIAGDHTEVFDYLLAHNLDRIRLGEQQHSFAALKAVLCQRRGMFDRLVGRDPTLWHAIWRSGASLVHYAAWAGDTALLEDLRSRGLPLDQPTGYGATALHFAVRSGDLATIRYLVAAGLDPRTVDKWGEGLLHWYAEAPYDHVPDSRRAGDPEIVDYLLGLGLDINAANQWGKTPLEVAEREGLREILEARGARRSMVAESEPRLTTAGDWAGRAAMRASIGVVEGSTHATPWAPSRDCGMTTSGYACL